MAHRVDPQLDIAFTSDPFNSRATVYTEASASAARITNDLQWLLFQRPESLQLIEATTQRLRTDLAPMFPPFAPPLHLADLPPDPLVLIYPPRPQREPRRMAHATLSYDQRVARMSPLQRAVIDAAFALVGMPGKVA